MVEYKRVQVFESAEAIADYPSQAIDAGGYFDAISVSGSGVLNELMVLSPNTSFKVDVDVDGSTILFKTYDELNALTQSLRYVSAFAELDENGDPTGNYLVHLEGISFLESLLVRIYNTGGVSTTFNIVGKYRVS